jgi:hypothetical protein
MERASLPFLLIASPAARHVLGRDLHKVAVMAVQALLRNRRGVEIALQQVEYRKRPFAFSSRIGVLGDLILELDIGDVSLDGRVFLEQELRKAQASATANASAGPARGRR